jgi:hypothetical protein
MGIRQRRRLETVELKAKNKKVPGDKPLKETFTSLTTHMLWICSKKSGRQNKQQVTQYKRTY